MVYCSFSFVFLSFVFFFFLSFFSAASSVGLRGGWVLGWVGEGEDYLLAFFLLSFFLFKKQKQKKTYKRKGGINGIANGVHGYTRGISDGYLGLWSVVLCLLMISRGVLMTSGGLQWWF